MAITVKHTKVSTIPDGDDSSLIRPSDWNDDHQLTGLGTMAEQNANNVTITGGSISGATVSGYIPTTEKAQPLGVATLDAGGKVPTSQIPQMGDLNYQGTWNASTNTPTLTSSTGTKGYYYVVSVAGTTNLDGITDWQIGDWAVFNGSTWQKIDNTDAVTSVNGYTGTVVLTQPDIAGTVPTTRTISTGTGLTGGGDLSANRTISFSTAAVGTWAETPSSANLAAAMTDETGSGSLVFGTNPTLSGPTIDGASPYINMTPTTAPTYAEGRVFYESSSNSLCYYNDNSQMTVNIGQEQIVRVRNQTGATIPDGTVVYVNGATGNTPTITKAIATSFSTSDIIGVTTTSIANNGFGYVTINGLVNGLDTSAFAEGDSVFLSATTAGAYTTTEPTNPNYAVQVGIILRANPSNGTLLVSIQMISVENIHIVGTIAVNQGGTGQTSYTDGQLLIGNTTGNTLTKSTLTAGTGISITNGAGAITITNSLPSLGGTVTSITAGTGLSGGTITTSGTIALANTTVSAGSYTNSSITVDAQGRLTSASSGTAPVTSVSGTTGRITSTGGTTPVIDLASGVATAGTTGSSTLIPVVTIDTYGRVTSITTASNPQGTVTSVSGTGTVSGISLSGTVTSSGSLTLGGTLDLSSPPAIGGTTPAAITGTTITATKFVGVSGGTF